MKISKGIFCLAIALSLIMVAKTAMAGGTVSGSVTCKRVRDPRDTVVFIEKMDGKFEAPAEHAVMDQQNLLYVPHVLPVLVGTSVDFPNSDTVRHNVFSPPGSAKVFNLGTYDVGVIKSLLFDVAGETPILCNVHAEMAGYIISLQNPYYALTDKSGTFTIEDVPPGKYTLTSWHEKLKPDNKEIEVKEGETVKVKLMLKKRR